VIRIQDELKRCHEKGEKSNIFISCCWNSIRTIVASKTFIYNHHTEIEEELKPLYEFVVIPEKVEFEDEIIFTLKTIIFRMKEVS
jgi:hypothetical protein